MSFSRDKHSEGTRFFEAFIEMDSRRLKRFMHGTHRPVSHRSKFFKYLVAFLVVLFLMTQLTVHMSRTAEQLSQSGEVSVVVGVVSFVLASMSLYDIYMHPDFILSKLALTVFSICAICYVRVYEFTRKPSQYFNVSLFSAKEQAVFLTFCTLELILFAVYIIVYVIFPQIGRVVGITPIVDRMWYRFRKLGDMHYSYRPYGPLFRRATFSYVGATDAEGRPDGLGTWKDDSYHGECLNGLWEHGIPIGPFSSRESGSGALFMSERVYYATSRSEGMTGSLCYPERDPRGLRYGVASVEAGCGGAFYEFLPQVNACNETRSICEVLKHHVTETELPVFTMVDEEDVSNASRGSLDYFVQDGKVCIVKSSLPMLQETKPEALIFFHGYNCDTDFAVCKLAQLLGLSKFPRYILPFVFSQSAGRSLSYWPAYNMLDEFAADAADFIENLTNNGVTKVHLLGHSMGCDLLLRAFLILAERGRISSGMIKNVILLNADYDIDLFEKQTSAYLDRYAERTTVYVDRNDLALIVSGAAMNGTRLGRIQRHLKTSAKIDVVDTTGMDQNIHSLRHSYFNLNMLIVADIEELVRTGLPAKARVRSLVSKGASQQDEYVFLCPPSFVNADKVRA